MIESYSDHLIFPKITFANFGKYILWLFSFEISFLDFTYLREINWNN